MSIIHVLLLLWDQKIHSDTNVLCNVFVSRASQVHYLNNVVIFLLNNQTHMSLQT